MIVVLQLELGYLLHVPGHAHLPGYVMHADTILLTVRYMKAHNTHVNRHN
jgi:hypothetical protein